MLKMGLEIKDGKIIRAFRHEAMTIQETASAVYELERMIHELVQLKFSGEQTFDMKENRDGN